jgi:mRNA-degrading endonuclease RelE of RelBE toxin-antitoxin system
LKSYPVSRPSALYRVFPVTAPRNPRSVLWISPRSTPPPVLPSLSPGRSTSNPETFKPRLGGEPSYSMVAVHTGSAQPAIQISHGVLGFVSYQSLAYNRCVIFIETSIFTKEVQDLLPDDAYRELQQAVLVRPKAGRLIPGSGGLRKLRWNLPQAGKRGGLRIVYYWDSPSDTIYMLLVYKKNRQEDLTQDQLRIVSRLMKEWLG